MPEHELKELESTVKTAEELLEEILKCLKYMCDRLWWIQQGMREVD